MKVYVVAESEPEVDWKPVPVAEAVFSNREKAVAYAKKKHPTGERGIHYFRMEFEVDEYDTSKS